MHLDTHGLPPTSIDHIAYVVKDLEATVKFFRTTFGIEPWSVPADYDTASVEQEEGEPFKVKFTSTVIGGISVDVLQPLDEESLFAKFVKETGGGIHHICFSPPWCAKEARTKVGQQPGIEVLLQGNVAERHWALFGKPDLPNIVVEVGDPGEHLVAYEEVE